MKNLGNHRRLLRLAAALTALAACTESEAPSPKQQPEVTLGTSSAALSFGAPALVRDLRTTVVYASPWDNPPGSEPAGFVAVGSTLFFVAQEASSGRELWKSDGTPEGTQLVRDIYPGPESSFISELTAVGDHVYFVATDGARGDELWKSDGTPEGTVVVRDIVPGLEGASVSNLKGFNGLLYFAAFDASRGHELWRSDGTAEGTVVVRDIVPGDIGSGPFYFAVAGNQLFFSAWTSATGRELWRTDGTAEGTRLVSDLTPGSDSSNIEVFWSVGNRVFFLDPNAGERDRLWVSDGTAEGTRLVFDATPGASSNGWHIQSVAAMNGLLYFSPPSYEPDNVGYELWATDGAAVWRVKDIRPGVLGSGPEGLTAVGNVLYFRALSDDSLGYELWKSDGTEQGTQLVGDLNPGSGSSMPQNLFALGTEVYFTAHDAVGRALWKSDGTPGGTRRVKSLQNRVNGSEPEVLTSAGGVLYLSATDGVQGVELWRSDGSEPGTHLVKDILVATADSNPQVLTPFNGGLAFTADVENLGREPWVTDGTASGTRLVKDVYPGGPGSIPGQLLPLNGALVFDATNGADGRELWTSDGTSAGTRLLKDIRTGSGLSSDPQGMTVIGDRLYFAANDGQTGREPWMSDGTTTGTRLIKDFNTTTPGASSTAGVFVRLKDRVYFPASSGTGRTLAMTDGTAQGTVTVANVDPYLAGGFVSMADHIYFAGVAPGTSDIELWRSDGTTAGTQLVKNIGVDSGFFSSSYPDHFAVLGGVLYFRAEETWGRQHLWRSDGTAAGTWAVKQLPEGMGNVSPRNLTTVNGVLLFQAYDPEGGIELWRSDGTVAGTRRVKDIHPGPAGSMAIQPMLALEPEGLVVFTASDGLSGMEPWVSDGTEAGTRRLADLAPGAYSSSPRLFRRVGTAIYFVANDGVAGFEPWRMVLELTPDTTPPTVTCPLPVSAEALSASGAPVSYPPATATDDQPGAPSLSYSQASGTVFPLGTTAVTVTARDVAGNTASCAFDVTVQDLTPPTLSCPADVTTEATSASGATVSYQPATATDAVTASPQVIYSHASGTEFPVGTTNVTVTARDDAGSSTVCFFRVIVRDVTKPQVSCPANVAAEATSAAGATVSYPPATATDTASPPVTLGYSQASGTHFPFGATVVTVTATDAAGNSDTCAFSVTVRDTTAPAPSCPGNVVAEATGASGATVSYPPATASDAVTSAPAIGYSHASGTHFPLGVTAVTATATDAAGNAATCIFSVTVRDTTAPTLSCPADITAEATGASGSTVSYPPASATDGVTGSVELGYSQASGTVFPLGTTAVTVTATDAAGNAATCFFNVTVRDTTVPALSCPGGVTAEATSASGASVSYPPATASDAVTGALTVSYSQASGTLFPVGTTVVTVTTADAAGNAASCTFDITVRDTTAPTLSCPTDVTAEATHATGATVEYAPAVASDSATLAYSHASGALFPLGATEVTVVARDAAGNEATCRFTLTVRDTTAPALSCPADLTVEAEDATGATATFTLPNPVDTVTSASQVSSSHAPGNRFPLGTTPVTVTARDAAANATSCTFSVTVRDTTPPAITCPADVTLKSSEAEGAAVTFTPATASDTVTASPQVTYSHASGSVFPQGTTPVTATARDEAGQTAECTFQVTVRRPVTVPVPDEPVGFGCTSGASGGVGGSAWLLLMGGVLLFQRRTRRSSVARGACSGEVASSSDAPAAQE
ncbi:ELWxxDGT repeat protein [Pyxidicoccus caerfyrddinensis]|uniref:ELWxxDGT repeat protein n=1 Tax=Pyxidicoccus caerfyrddinensis TaxID=2709663 RepID=UPI0013DCD96E|nr:ELWxxDGT repeat protein [Pyxidicoccus caerfyrddinensis]